MNYSNTILNEIKKFSRQLNEDAIVFSNSEFFPWSGDFERYVQTLKENRDFIKLAQIYELSGIMNRNILGESDASTIYSHYIASSILFCASSYYYAANERTHAKALAQNAYLGFDRIANKMELRDTVRAVVLELIGDLNLFINHHGVERYYELAIHYFEQNPAEEGGETHDWYWNVCAFEMFHAVDLVLGVRYTPGDMKTYQNRMQMKRRLKDLVNLNIF